jgi:agmatine/peptidylarginine deiminase
VNSVFELNWLVYGLYTEDTDDDVDDNLGTKVKGKEVAKSGGTCEGTYKRKAPAPNKKTSHGQSLLCP